jgi:hypothetical protein
MVCGTVECGRCRYSRDWGNIAGPAAVDPSWRASDNRPAQEIVFLADEDLRVVLGAADFGPFRLWIGVANVFLVDGPGRVSALSMTVISSCRMFEQ